MRNLHRLVASVLIVGLALTGAYLISAQQDRPRRGGERRQMDPAVMIERAIEQAVRRLNLSDDEAAVIKPKIKNILQTRWEHRQQIRDLTQALRTAINANDEAQIKSKLTDLKTKQKEHRAKEEKVEKELIELLTVKQEAQLTVAGVVNRDGMGSFFGGFRGQPQRPRGRGGQR